MNRKRSYFIGVMLTVVVILSSLVQVFAVQGKLIGDDVYRELKDKYEWEYRSDTILEDYLTKGLIFENNKGNDGYDMSLTIPSTDSFGGVIEGFNVMLGSEDEAIRLFLDFINKKETFEGNYGNRKVEVIYSEKGDTKVKMYGVRENYLESLGLK